MGKKQTKTKTPKPKRRSDRKRKRTAKGEYYHQNFNENSDDSASNQVKKTRIDPPPAPDKSVSMTVEKGDILTISPPVPDQTVSFAVEKGTLSPPVPEQSVSVTVEEGDRGERSLECNKLLRRSEIPILQDIPTPVLLTPMQSTFRSRDRAESTPSSVFCGNRTFPVVNSGITDDTAASETPVRAVRRTKSLNLREELDLAESLRLANEGEENDISECKELQEEEQEDTDKLELTDHHSWKFLENVYELIHYPKSKQQSGTETAELEKTISQHAERINELMHERKVQDLQIESLNKRLFHKDQELKIHSDRIKQLQDSNNYRNEVVRLEGVAETNELKLRAVKEELDTKVNNIQILEEKLKGKKELETTFQEQTEKIKILEGQLKKWQEEGKEIVKNLWTFVVRYLSNNSVCQTLMGLFEKFLIFDILSI